MRRFLKNIAHFTLYLVLINLLCFLVIKASYYDEYSVFDPSFETYLLADSHGHALDDLTEEVGIFNFSDPSDSYEDMLRKVKYIILNSEVKKILLSVDAHTLSTYRNDNNNLDRSTIYASREDFKSDYDQFQQRYVKRYVPLLHGKSRDALLMYIKSLLPQSAREEVLWEKKTPAERNSKASQRANIHFKNATRSKKMEALLLEIINLCQQNDVQLLGIKFPLTAEYAAAIKTRGYETDDILRDNGIEVLDFRTVFSTRNDYFRDQDHLSTLGAEAFLQFLK
jgi:hypothetical protein